MNNPFLRNLIVWAVILAVAFPIALQLSRASQREIAYGAFLEQVRAGHVEEVGVRPGVISGLFKGGGTFFVKLPKDETSYRELLRKHRVSVRVEAPLPETFWPGLVVTLSAALLVICALTLMLRRYSGVHPSNLGGAAG